MDATGSGFTAAVPLTVPDFTEDTATEKCAGREVKLVTVAIIGNMLSFGMSFGKSFKYYHGLAQMHHLLLVIYPYHQYMI